MHDDIVALFRRLTNGVYIVGVAHGIERNAFTAAWVMQVSFRPLLLALGISPEHASYPLLRDGGSFTINVLHTGQLELARQFGTRSGREVNKLAGVTWRPGRGSAPILTQALAYFDCQVVSSLPTGDHETVIGHVVEGAVLASGAMPMGYNETGDMDGSSALYPSHL